MARRIAAVGYFVVLPNLYYRRSRDYFLKERTEPAWPRCSRTWRRSTPRPPNATRGRCCLRRCRGRGRRQPRRRGRLLHERPVRDVGGGGLPGAAPLHRLDPRRQHGHRHSPTRRTGWRRRSAARATSPAPRSTSGRRPPTSPSSRRRCATRGRRTGSSGTRASSTASSSRSVPASTTSRRRAALGAVVQPVRAHAAASAGLTKSRQRRSMLRKSLEPLAQERRHVRAETRRGARRRGEQAFPNDSAEYRARARPCWRRRSSCATSPASPRSAGSCRSVGRRATIHSWMRPAER